MSNENYNEEDRQFASKDSFCLVWLLFLERTYLFYSSFDLFDLFDLFNHRNIETMPIKSTVLIRLYLINLHLR